MNWYLVREGALNILAVGVVKVTPKFITYKLSGNGFVRVRKHGRYEDFFPTLAEAIACKREQLNDKIAVAEERLTKFNEMYKEAS